MNRDSFHNKISALIGCHVSIAGGMVHAPERAAAFGCTAMQIFTRPPQGGPGATITSADGEAFIAECTARGILCTVVHAPYYINFLSQNNRIRYGSVHAIRAELERADLLGVRYVMVHLGSYGKMPRNEGNDKLVELLGKTLEGYAGTTELLIENSAGAGAVIGDTFDEIRDVLDRVNHPSLTGVCVDTQHAFASGYDLRAPHTLSTLERISEEVGGAYRIKMFHVNDSKVPFASHRDRHEHLGKGALGADAFDGVVAFAQRHHLPMIVETEHDCVAEDLALLKDIAARV